MTTESKCFLLWNRSAGFIGNSPLFWRKGESGYTPYIDEAERFALEEAIEIAQSTRGTHRFSVVSMDKMEHISKRVVDVQDIDYSLITWGG